MTAHMSDSAQWLEWLFGQEPPGRIWIGGHGDGFRGRTFATPGEAAEYAQVLDGLAAGGVYFRLTLVNEIISGRGSAADSSHLVAFGADLDLDGPGHKAAKLPRPRTEDELWEILAAARAPEPTAWVHSGGGRYAFWKLAEPITLAGDVAALEAASAASAVLHERIIATAAERGLKIDNTRDLARIYRLPGTHNRKGDVPWVAKVMTSIGPAHRLDTFTALSRPAATSLVDTRGHLESAQVKPSVDTPAPAAGARSSLFGDVQPAVRGSVAYTVADAMTFVAPALDRLRTARDGEINVRLNEAAVTLAHFGQEFWTREAAEKQLHLALAETVYDGATWQAADTIRSAYEAMAARGAAGDPDYWRAELIQQWSAEPGPAVTADAVDALLAEMLTADELAERKPPRYMIKNLLTYDSEAWLIGGPGSKKSFVAFDMAANVALGRPWQGHRVNPGLVVFIAAEGAGGIGKRARAWRDRYGSIPADRMRTLPRPVQVAELDKWAVLIEACRRLRQALDPDLGMFIIVDTQARSAIGLDENSAKEIGVYISAMAQLRKATGACVLSVHHTTKAGETTRGSSALDGAQDTRLLMRSERGSLEAILKIDKQKDLEQIDDLELHFGKVPVGQDEDGEDIDSLVLLPHDGWLSGLFDRRSAVGAASAETPFARRQAPEPWTFAITAPDAMLQRWLLQALADTAEDRGLTQAEWRGLVDEKLGKKKPTASAWRKAFQRVTSSDPAFSEVVVKIHGADRWTVDKVAIKEETEK